MGSQQQPRAIAPKPGDSIFRTDISFQPRLQKASSACLECWKRKQRVGLLTYPGETLLIALGIQCVFDPLKDNRRKLNAQRAHETVSRLVSLLQQGSDRDLGLLRESVRLCDSLEQAMETLSLFLSSFSGPYDTYSSFYPP
jgi:hypothetical protein